ncbi:MAG: hypothetical protein QE271_09235 [Bacteriovoracaceae bacterium]|nr:hypothetical protein [Bacteriovoracaceae bacterium]
MRMKITNLDNKKLKSKSQISEMKELRNIRLREIDLKKNISKENDFTNIEKFRRNDFEKEYSAASIQKQIDRNKRLDDAFVVYSD